MTRSSSHNAATILPWLFVAVFVLSAGCLASAAAAAPDRSWAAPVQGVSREVALTRIVSALEERLPSHELPAKAKAKLLTMSDRQLRVAASLAERIARDDPAPVSETAFFLLSLLIILS